MTTYRITPLTKSWCQIVEAGPDGSVAEIGCFRTEADAQAWLDSYVRMKATGARVPCIGWPAERPGEAVKETVPQCQTEAPG